MMIWCLAVGSWRRRGHGWRCTVKKFIGPKRVVEPLPHIDFIGDTFNSRLWHAWNKWGVMVGIVALWFIITEHFYKGQGPSEGRVKG